MMTCSRTIIGPLASYQFSPNYTKLTIVADQLMEYFKSVLMIFYVHIERIMVQNMYSSNRYIHGIVLQMKTHLWVQF